MIVGISGKARVGKDTIGGILKKELFEAGKGEFQLMEFSRAIKERIAKDFDLSPEQLYDDLKESPDKRYIKKGIKSEGYWTPREMLQAYGEFFRTIDDNFWVNEVFKNKFENLIITDVRHKEEVKAVKDRGGYHVRIYRNHNIEVHGKSHISEIALDFIDVDSADIDQVYIPDFKIENNNSIKDLTNVVKDIILMIYKLEEFNKSQLSPS